MMYIVYLLGVVLSASVENYDSSSAMTVTALTHSYHIASCPLTDVEMQTTHIAITKW